MKIIIEVLEVIILFLALSWFTKTYLFSFYQVNEEGMLPTLGPNNHVIVNKFNQDDKSIGRDHIIVFQSERSTAPSIKRLIGYAGDKIEIRNGFTYVNGVPLYEPYAYTPVAYSFAPVTVPKDHVFVLNDNRIDHNDSRSFGCISNDSIIGRAVFCYWPWTKIKSL